MTLPHTSVSAGIIGDWKNYFTAEQSREFDELYAQRMAGSQLDLVFEPQDALDRMRKFGRIIVAPEPKLTWNHRDTSSDPGAEEEEEDGTVSKRPFPCFFDSPPVMRRRETVLHHPFMTPDPLTLTG